MLTKTWTHLKLWLKSGPVVIVLLQVYVRCLKFQHFSSMDVHGKNVVHFCCLVFLAVEWSCVLLAKKFKTPIKTCTWYNGVPRFYSWLGFPILSFDQRDPGRQQVMVTVATTRGKAGLPAGLGFRCPSAEPWRRLWSWPVKGSLLRDGLVLCFPLSPCLGCFFPSFFKQVIW